MNETRNSILPNGNKLPPWAKTLFIVIAAVVPAWTGAVKGFVPDNAIANEAQAHAVRADEKADLAYQLLNQKVHYENAALNARVESLEKQLQRIERKLDLSIRSGRGGYAGLGRGAGAEGAEPAEEDSATAFVPSPAPKNSQVALPPSLDAAYAKKKSGESIAMGAGF